MSREKWVIPVTIILVLIFSLCVIITCIRYDNYVNELKEKAQKYEMIENKIEKENKE